MTTGPEHSPDVRDETLPGQQADRTPAATPDDTPTSKRTLWPRRPNGIRPSGTGVARVLVTGALLGGLVAAASTSSAVIDLARPGTSTDTETGQASQALATNSALTCVGPELSGVKGAPDIPQEITVAGEAAPTDLTKASGTGSLRLAAGQTPPVVTDTERHLSTLVSAASPVTVTATGGVAPGLAALQQFSADTKDLRGLATTPCASASAESWLIAGGGAPGRQERLLLANPGANEITVDVNVIGAEGPVASDNGRGIVVPGRGRTNVLVDAIAGGEPSPVLQVTVRGGAVVAALSDVWLDGSVAAGLEMTVPTESPDTTLILPIVDLTQAGVLRVAVPGEAQAVVSARLLSTTGASPLPGGGVHRVPGRTSVDLPLADIPAGTYALEVTSDVPVVAAAMAQAREGSAPGDFAWSPAADPIAGIAGLPLPPAGDKVKRQLGLVASAQDATVTVVTRKGGEAARRSVSLVADRLTLVDLAAAESVWVGEGPETGVRAAVLTTSGEGASRLLAVAPLHDLLVTTTSARAHPLP